MTNLENNIALTTALDTNVALADALLDGLEFFDSRGYDKQGKHALAFVRSINEFGFISTNVFNEYLDEIEDLNGAAGWMRPETEIRFNQFHALLNAHAEQMSVNSSRAIIHFILDR